MTFRIEVPSGYIAVLVNRGAITKTFGPGIHWGAFVGRVVFYTAEGRFSPPAVRMSLESALADEELAQYLDITEVKEGHIGIVFRNGVYEEVITAGTHAFFKGFSDTSRGHDCQHTVVCYDMDAVFAPPDLATLARRHGVVRTLIDVRTVPTGHAGLLLVNGKVFETLEAGNHALFSNGNSYELKLAPQSIDSLELSGQEVLTADKATVRLNFYLRYKVTDLKVALLEVIDYTKELRLAAAMALREYVGSLSLEDLLSSKLAAGSAVLKHMSSVAPGLGIEILAAGVRDVILPGDMRAIYNQVLMATKTAEANAIARRDEVAATRTKLNAAKLMEDHPMLKRLTELDYVERIASHVDRLELSPGKAGVLVGLQELLGEGK